MRARSNECLCTPRFTCGDCLRTAGPTRGEGTCERVYVFAARKVGALGVASRLIRIEANNEDDAWSIWARDYADAFEVMRTAGAFNNRKETSNG